MTSRNRQGVAHEWTRANDTDHGKTSTGNLFYRGRTIYSYGTHFPIAKHGYVTKGEGDECQQSHVVLANWSSSTTSGHQCAVRRAIPGSWIVFDVPHIDFDWATGARSEYEANLADVPNYHRLNWQSIVDAHQSELEKSVRARTMRASHLSNAETLRQRANQYHQLFNLDVADIPQNPDIQASIEAARVMRDEYERKNEERRVAEQSEKLQRWLDGHNSPTPYFDGEVKLRISADGRNIETSKGASFPVRHALRAYPVLQSLHSLTVTHVVTTDELPALSLGHYQIDGINSNGVVAGCHVVSWAEIERIYPLAIAAQTANHLAGHDDYPEVSAVGSTLHS